MYGHGIDKIGSLLDVAEHVGVLERKGAWRFLLTKALKVFCDI